MPFDEWKEGDPLPNADQALIDERRFMEYVLNPEHPGHAHKNKWMAFEEIGYDVHTPDGRRKATEDITRQLVRQLNGAIAVRLERRTMVRALRLRRPLPARMASG